MPLVVFQLSAMATSPVSPFGEAVAVDVGVGVGVGDGVGVGVTTVLLEPPSVAAPVGLALLVPQAEVRAKRESANALSSGCDEARLNISFLNLSKPKKNTSDVCTMAFNYIGTTK
jgi:hypothetical protein